MACVVTRAHCCINIILFLWKLLAYRGVAVAKLKLLVPQTHLRLASHAAFAKFQVILKRKQRKNKGGGGEA